MQQNNAQPLPNAAVLLDQIYQAMLRSDYAALSGLAADLERELQNPTGALTESGLRLIHQKAGRNAAVLTAAQRGIRSARRRLAEIRATASGLVTYDSNGRRTEVSESRSLAQRL